MATIAGLNNDFFKTVEAAIKCKKNETGAWVAADGTALAGPKADLVNLYAASRTEIEELAKRDNSARGPIMRLLKEKVPNKAQLEEIKEGFEKRHKELVTHLKAIHERQYDQFELEMEKDPSFPLAERHNLLMQLKTAQQAQLRGLEERAKNDQERLDNVTDMTTERDQKFALFMLDRAEKEREAMVQRYRPFGIGAGEVGHVEIEQAKEFSVRDVFQETDTSGGKHWRAKDKKMMEMGATEVGGGRKKSKGEQDAEEWAMITKDYLAGRPNDVLILDDLPTAGIFKGMGAVALYQALGILTMPQLVIELNARVLADEKEGIEAANGVVRCTFPVGASKEQKIVVLNVLAQVYMAKGWQGVELGNQTPQDLWEDAYIACRKAGFRHDQIRFKGELMNTTGVRLKGDQARAKLEDAFKEKEARPEEAKKINDAMLKLANVIYNPDLSRETFFALPEDVLGEARRLALFKEGGLDQQAEIIADYAFDEAKLPEYMEAVTAAELATVLDDVAERNPDRLLEAFKAIDVRGQVQGQTKQGEQQKVFDMLDTGTQAQLLMQMPKAARGFFERLSLPQPVAPGAENPKFHLLANPHLSDAMVYELYDSLPMDIQPQSKEKHSPKQQALSHLAQSNKKALGTIVAQSFLPTFNMNVASMKPHIKELTRILNKQDTAGKDAIMAAIYKALPTQPDNLRTTFLQQLQAYETAGHGSTHDLRTLYEKARTDNIGIGGKFSDTAIRQQKTNLLSNNNNAQQAAANYFYTTLPPAEAANALRSSSLGKRVRQLEMLVTYAQNNANNTARLAEIAVQLGPELAGKALAGFQDLNKAHALVIAIQGADGKSNSKFLANALSVYYNKTDDTGKAILKSPNFNVAAMLPYISHPGLIKQLVEGRKISEIIPGIKAASNNKAQQANIFKQLSSPQQMDIMFDDSANSVSLIQKSMLFASLQKADQITYIQKCPGMNDKTSVANHLLACWRNVYLSEQKDHHENSDALLRDNNIDLLNLFVHQSSQTNVPFLAHLFSTCPADKLNGLFNDVMTLDQRFNSIPQANQKIAAKDAYLMNVGQAIAALADKPKQLALFVTELNKIYDQNPADADTVRAYALIDLMAKGDRKTAQALFKNPDLAPAKDALKAKVVDLARELPTDFKNSLHALVGAPPVQQQQQQHQQGPAANQQRV